MIEPAALYKEIIIARMTELFYTDDMMLVTGSLSNWLPEIEDEPNEQIYQWAVLDGFNLIGYISYSIDWYSSQAYDFGIISFEKNNPAFGKELKNIMNRLLNDYKLHRIEWRMVGGNPVERHYDKFCERHGGRKFVLRDRMKDRNGKYHDDVVYEIIREEARHE